jgi:hemerythrin
MPLLEWSEDLSIGLPDTDEEHMKLVQILNDLDVAVQAKRGTRVMNRILGDLMTYTVEHFASEEAAMEEVDYPDLKLHRSQHRQLVQKLEKQRRDFQVSGRRITKEMMEFLKYWLAKHILGDDMAFGKYCQDTGRFPEPKTAPTV